eukprot:g3382.t1
MSAPSSSSQSFVGGEKASADITGTDKAKQAPEQLSPQCRAKIYAYHVLKHRNREMCHDIREKCKAALESHCTAGKIRGGGAARTLEDGGAESGSGVVPSMVGTTPAAPAAPTAAFVAWPLEKECLRTLRSKSALVTEECKAALFAEDVVAATTSFRFGGWSGTLDVRSHAIAQPTKTSTDAQEPKTGAEEKASGGRAPRDSSLDFAPLLKSRCESELAAGKCRGWGSELQCLENLATRDFHKELQLKGATAMKTVISYGSGSNVTSSSVGWTSVGGPMKKALPPTSRRTRGLAAGVEVPEKTSVLAANAASSPLYLSQACRKQVQTSVRDRLRDIRLSPELAEKCRADIGSLCPAPGSSSVTNTTRHGKDVASGRVLHCLRRRYYEIQSQDCVDAFRGVLKTMQLDWAADSVTKKACQADRQLLCAHVKNANLVHLCLQEHIDELETDCQKEEFMVSSYAQLDVKTASPYLARMCLLDLDKYCGGTDASDVRALTCLKRQPAHTLHASCEVALRSNELRTSQDYRLKFGVTQSCQKEIQTHCSAEAGLQKPEGKVLLCLVKNLDTIRSGVLGGAVVDGNSPAMGGVSSGGGSLRAQNQACVSEIQDLANEMGHDVKAAKQVQLACANDIADKCKHVEPGGGRIHDCLVDNLPKLSTECAKKEMQLQSALYSGGANLLPAGLRQCCSRELGLFCASKDHGKSDNKVNCLLQSKSLPETSYRCRECLQRHVKRQNRDFRLSPGLKRECQREIETDCKAALQEQTKNPGKAGGRVIQCLIDNREKLAAAGGNAGCLKAVQLKIRQRADDYRVTPFFHTACETDLATFCKDVKPGNGAVHKCLADHLGQISQSCRALEFRSMAQTSVEDHPLIRTYCRAAYIDATVDRASSSTTPGPPPLKPGSPPHQNRAPCGGGLRGSELFACLERNRDNTEFVSEKCREAIVQVGAKQAKSVLLSPGLTARCGETLNQFVAEGKCPSGTQPITLSKSTGRGVDVAAASSSFVAGATASSKTSAKPTRAALEAGAAGVTTPSPPVAASTSAAASAPTSAAAASAASTPTAPAPKAGAPLVPSQPTLPTKAAVSGRAVDFMSRIKSWNATGSSASGGGGGGGGKGILCLVDNYKLIQDKACQSVVFRQARMQVRNPFQYRPGFREKCAPVVQKNCKREQVSGFRLMLEEQDSLSWESWVETEVESDGMSHEEFAFDEGGYAGEGDEFGFERGYYEHEFGFASDYEEFAFESGAVGESGDFEEPEFSPGPYTTPRDLQAAFLINQVTARKHLHCLADLAPAAFGGPAGGECKEEIRKISVLSSQDLRLHPQLERRCAHEIKHFCSHLAPGESRVLTCLKAELEIDEARGAALRASKDPKAAKMAAAAQNNNKPATSSTFTQACRISLSRVVLPEVVVETYKSTLGNSRNFPQLVAERALGKLGLYDEATDQVSFLTLRGPVALLALLSMAFSSFVLCYVVYRKRKTAGYTSYVPDEGRAGGGAGTGFCSFKVKLKQPPQTFCRNEYNVTGLCNRVSCPLANSEYATVLEKEGLCYLYIKTVERAHTPRKLWEKIELSKNFMQALTQIDEHLMHWADHKKNRCKQRLTKLRQVLLRQRKAALEPKLTTTVGVKKKTERREATREAKAEKAAKVETTIERELLERLKLGTYGDLYKTNEQRNAEKDAARSKRRKEEIEVDEEEDVDCDEQEQELEYEDDDEAARMMQLEDEDEEVDERDLAYVADMGDDDDSDDDGIPDEDLSDLSDVADLSELSDDDADEDMTPATRASSTGGDVVRRHGIWKARPSFSKQETREI